MKKISWWIWTQKLLLPHGFVYYVFNKAFYHDPTARNIQHLNTQLWGLFLNMFANEMRGRKKNKPFQTYI